MDFNLFFLSQLLMIFTNINKPFLIALNYIFLKVLFDHYYLFDLNLFRGNLNILINLITCYKNILFFCFFLIFFFNFWWHFFFYWFLFLCSSYFYSFISFISLKFLFFIKFIRFFINILKSLTGPFSPIITSTISVPFGVVII